MIRRAAPCAVLALWLAAICWCSAGCEPAQPRSLSSPLTVYENADGRISIEPRLPEHAR